MIPQDNKEYTRLSIRLCINTHQQITFDYHLSIASVSGMHGATTKRIPPTL